MPGFTIGKYEVGEVLGEGPWGKVYEAVDTTDGQRFALRAFAKPKGVDEEHWRLAVERFDQELRPAQALSHPNINAVYDYWQQNDVYVIRSEYFKARNLRQMLDAQGRIDMRRALTIVTTVCGALHYAHQRGAVHSDITPYNILCGEDQLIKIINFGLGHARAKDDSPYRAPEQVAGHEADARSDLFSLGVVFYEMLTGRCPFLGKDPAATADAILHRPAAPVADVPTWLGVLISKLLAKDPDQRYQNVPDVLQDIEAAERLEGTAGVGAVSSAFGLERRQPKPSLADYRQLRRCDLRAYRKLLTHRATARLLRQHGLRTWARRLVVLAALAGLLVWDISRGGPTARLLTRVGLLHREIEIGGLPEFIPTTPLEQQALSSLVAIAAGLDTLRAESAYPMNLNLETLGQLDLPPENVKTLLEPFEGHRLASYDRTRTGYRITVRLRDAQGTRLILQPGTIKRLQ